MSPMCIAPKNTAIGISSHSANEGSQRSCPVIKVVTEKFPHEFRAQLCIIFGCAKAAPKTLTHSQTAEPATRLGTEHKPHSQETFIPPLPSHGAARAHLRKQKKNKSKLQCLERVAMELSSESKPRSMEGLARLNTYYLALQST